MNPSSRWWPEDLKVSSRASSVSGFPPIGLKERIDAILWLLWFGGAMRRKLLGICVIGLAAMLGLTTSSPPVLAVGAPFGSLLVESDPAGAAVSYGPKLIAAWNEGAGMRNCDSSDARSS